MTSLYRCRASLSEIARAFDADVPVGLDWQPTIWPEQEGLVIVHDSEKRVLRRMRCGLPGRAPVAGRRQRVTPYINNLMSNLGFGNRLDPPERCLIIVEAFALPDGDKGNRTQTWFGLENEPLFAWAGVSREMPGYGHGYVGLMTAPNSLIAPIADQMPAMLDRDDLEAWLTAPLAQAARCLRPFPPERMYIESTEEPWPGHRSRQQADVRTKVALRR